MVNDCPYHLFIVTPVRFSLPTIHPSVRRRANSLRQHSKNAFFHSGIKFAGSLETARNVTLPIIPWSLRQAGSLMARLENAAPSSSCHCKLSPSHESSGLSVCGSTIAAPRPMGTFAKCSSAISSPPRLNYTIASPVRDILYDLKQRLGHRKCLMIGRL